MDLDSAPQVLPWVPDSPVPRVLRFSLTANFLIPSVCDFDFMAIINLKIYIAFDRPSCPGCNFTPSVIIRSQIPYDFSNVFILIKLNSLTLRS